MSKIANVNFKLDYESKKVGKERRIPFEVSIDPFFSDSNIRYLKGIKNKINSIFKRIKKTRFFNLNLI